MPLTNAGQDRCAPCPVLVCFAVSEEARFFSLSAVKEHSINVVLTGIGQRNAARVLQDTLHQQSPALILTCGFAGGLRPGLKVGTVLYSEEGGAGIGRILSELGAVPANFYCSPRIAVTAAEKRVLFARTGADAIEMESEIIRQICRRRRLPCATVRIVSDGAEEDLPLDFNALLTESMTIAYPRLIWRVLSSPTTIPGLLHFQRQTRAVAQRLAETLTELLRRQCSLAG